MNTERNEFAILQTIIKTFGQIRQEIVMGKYNHEISRNQGTNLKNLFAFKIMDAIKYTVDDYRNVLTRPFLYLTTDINDSFEREKLILFINNEMCILIGMQESNDSAINNYYIKFRTRLLYLIE